MKTQLTVFKIGGKVLEDSAALEAFLKEFSVWPGAKILVHGGGQKASQLAKQMGLTPQMVNGRRITDAGMLEVALMVYGGFYNKTIVAQLQRLGVNAIGLSGADGNTILAEKRPAQEIDFGFVGDVRRVNQQRLQWLLESELVPVFCALTHDGQGHLLNTNADTIATELATAMSNIYDTQLIFCFEKAGVLRDANDEGSVIPHLNRAGFEALRKQNVVTDGMLPKLDNAFKALQNGVKQVRITHVHHLNQGTLITLD